MRIPVPPCRKQSSDDRPPRLRRNSSKRKQTIRSALHPDKEVLLHRFGSVNGYFLINFNYAIHPRESSCAEQLLTTATRANRIRQGELAVWIYNQPRQRSEHAHSHGHQERRCPAVSRCN